MNAGAGFRILPPAGRGQSVADDRARIRSIPTPCWSRSCCRPRRPTPASTSPPATCSSGSKRRSRWSPSARTRCATQIKTIGLFNTKAKNVIALSKALIREFGGEVPRTREALQSLPGVGRKTANVVLNTAFGEETFAVDTHVFRVCNRTGLAPGKTVDEVEAKLEKDRAAAVSPRRAPLADPARPLHLQGADARMLAMPGDRPLPLQAQDAARLAPNPLEPRAERRQQLVLRQAGLLRRRAANRSRARPSRLR